MAFNITSNVSDALNAMANIGTEKKVAEQTKQQRDIAKSRAEAEVSLWSLQSQSGDITRPVEEKLSTEGKNYADAMGKYARGETSNEVFEASKLRYRDANSALQQRLTDINTSKERIANYRDFIMNYGKEKDGKV